MLESFAAQIPPALLDRSGAVFNTGRNAFRGNPPLYLLGLNPGGNPDTHGHETVCSHTAEVLRQAPGWAAYRDDSWNGRAPGSTGMQPRIQHLFRKLGLQIDSVPMSNLVFERTRSAADLKNRLRELASLCWPLHQKVLEELTIRTIVCLGSDCGDWVCARLGAGHQIGEFIERNDRRWASRAFRNESGIKVIVLTHPAIANWVHEPADPTPLVASLLERRS